MIRLEGVEKSFDGGHAALAGVDLDIAAGEIFGIIGRSGAGKSTLVRLLNGLERPSAGRVLVDGIDVATLRAEPLRALRRRIGMIFQNFGLLSSRTAAGNVALPLRIAGASSADIAAKVPALLDRVGLADHGGRYPAQLSGGQKQRVGIARALATGPDMLLCDEATSALDPETTRSILALIADLNRDLGLTILLITHEMDVVRQVCDRVAVLHTGRIVESGHVADLFLDPQAPETHALLAEAGEDTDAADPGFAGTILRFTLEGGATWEPVLTRIARETGVDFAILGGRIGRFKTARYGQFTLGLTGGDTEAAIAALRRHGRVAA
ncbi:methionine ABC transporter ATP-binding protein [uncultured Sphingomonas sp.]|uniref:methionine ABC transporter ATP-binding protein n=1 Tax=uncultured Sphingomonas sp. TaxID=158754 RepID=UPI0035CC59A0